jgi:predicted dehydrogenase
MVAMRCHSSFFIKKQNPYLCPGPISSRSTSIGNHITYTYNQDSLFFPPAEHVLNAPLGAIAPPAKFFLADDIPHGEITAVCDTNPDRIQWARENMGENVRTFDKGDDTIQSGAVDAIIVATHILKWTTT